MAMPPSTEKLADRRQTQREILLRYVERQMETGKWLLASLLVVNGGAVVALLSNEKLGAKVPYLSGMSFVAGVLFAFLAGGASWEFSNQVVYQLRKKLEVPIFDDEMQKTNDRETTLPATLPIVGKFVFRSRTLRVAMLVLSIFSLIAFAIGALLAADALSGSTPS